MQPQVQLTPALQIGFSGHRVLSDEKLCRTAILKVLAEWKTKMPGGISGLSSLAAGGDLLFAEACFELGIPLRVLLPLPMTGFREDFDATTWGLVERALERVSSFEIVDGGTERPGCYYECGLETLHQCGLIIVLWNGRPARGPGGTGEMANQGKNLGIPTIWIHSETGEITQWNTDGSCPLDPELRLLNNLPDGEVKVGVTPKEQALAWFEKLDENANQVAPQFRKITAIPILCAGAGALLTTAAYSFKREASVLFGLSALLGLAATFVPGWLKGREKQEGWAKTRAAAEISRSFVALWNVPARYSVMDKSGVPELEGMLNALNHLKMLEGFRQLKDNSFQFKMEYLKERVHGQAAYFSRQTERAVRAMSRALAVIRYAVFFAIGGNLFMVVSQLLHLLPAGAWMIWLGLAIVLAFQIAAGAGALIVINDYARRQRRYLEMRRLILNYATQLEQAQTWASILRIVTLVEKTLLTEVLEWRALFRNQKFGK